jgi:transposase
MTSLRGTRAVGNTTSLEDVLGKALRNVPEDGADVAELMRMTGMGRSTVYRYLAQFAEDGRAVQVEWGRWRAANTGGGDDV